MKKLFNLLVLFALGLGFTSCINDEESDPIYYFYDEPAIFGQIAEKPIVRTAYGTFYVPSLAQDSLENGALLWSEFVVNKTDTNNIALTSDTSCYIARGFRYERIDSSKVIIPVNNEEFEFYLSDDYSENMDLAVLYRTSVDRLLFFGFTHENKSTYEYEMVLSPDEKNANGFPTLYIRSKKKEIKEPRREEDIVYAFEMTDYIEYFRKNVSESGAIRFNLKYKIATKDGKDEYRAFLSNPLSWDVK